MWRGALVVGVIIMRIPAPAAFHQGGGPILSSLWKKGAITSSGSVLVSRSRRSGLASHSSLLRCVGNEEAGSDLGSKLPSIAQKRTTPSSMVEKLKEYGLSGILAYGFLNFLHYSVFFTIMWRSSFGVATAGAQASAMNISVRRALAVLAAVWVGSQATKIFRVGGALVLAPMAEKLLSWAQERMGPSASKGAVVASFTLGLLTLSLFILGSQVLAGALIVPGQ